MVRIQKKFIVFLTFIHFLELSCHSDAINKYYRSRENKILKTKMDEDRWIYKRDSINLSLMILSLIMTIIITDFLKKYGINFLQDTHISFVFGIIIGVIFNTMPHTTDIANSPSVVINRTEKHDSLNLHLLLFSSDDKESRTYVYDYSGILSDAVRDERILTIKPRSFFSYILTPIIYATALEIHGDEFLHFMPVITVFAFLGSIMSIICSSLMIYCCSPIIKLSLANFQLKHSLAFSVFTSCTDPVSIIPLLSGLGFDNIIYYSLFGESALNDAVCLVADDILKEVLINDVMFFSFITQFCILFIIKLFSSVLLGSIFGCLTSFTLKKLAI
ncbi:MAG: monovalent cation proton antiporter 1 (CPA1) transporter, partial [Marteilia pararefringens]